MANIKGHVSQSPERVSPTPSGSDDGGEAIAATATTARAGAGTKAPLERRLEDLRPLGQRYVRAHFGPGLSAHDAEDVVSEVIARLFFRLERGEGTNNLNALFFTSVHNASVDLTRQRRRRPEAPLEAAPEELSAVPEPLEQALASDTGALVRDVLTRIRPRYREALALRFGIGLNTVEIAERKGMSITAAKKLVNRAAHETESELARLRGGEHCPEAQRLISNGSFSRALTDAPAAAEIAQLNSHLAHCGSCKSFLSQLKGLHELAGTALLTDSAADAAGHRVGIAQHLSSWAAQVTDLGHAAADRARLAMLKAGGQLTASDGASAGAITGTAKQITAICATGAAAATCIATGVVGPGIGGAEGRPAADQPPVVQTTTTTTTTTPASPTGETSPAPGGQESSKSTPTATPEPTPAQQQASQFGIEQTPSSSSQSTVSSGEFSPPPGGSGAGGGATGGGVGFER